MRRRRHPRENRETSADNSGTLRQRLSGSAAFAWRFGPDRPRDAVSPAAKREPLSVLAAQRAIALGHLLSRSYVEARSGSFRSEPPPAASLRITESSMSVTPSTTVRSRTRCSLRTIVDWIPARESCTRAISPTSGWKRKYEPPQRATPRTPPCASRLNRLFGVQFKRCAEQAAGDALRRFLVRKPQRRQVVGRPTPNGDRQSIRSAEPRHLQRAAQHRIRKRAVDDFPRQFRGDHLEGGDPNH